LELLLRHEVADRGAERAGQDVRQPEREDGVEAQSVVHGADRRDDAAPDRGRRPVAEAVLLGDEVARGGAEREREEDRQPVERLGGW
jgi:hypothetical protein